MSWKSALADDVFVALAASSGGVLLLGGLVLAGLQLSTRCDLRHGWTSYRAWWVMTPCVLGAVFLGRGATILFLTGLSVFAFKEFARATGLYRDWVATITVYVGIVAMGLSTWIHDPFLDRPGWLGLFLALPVLVVGAILVGPVLRDRSRGQLQSMALATFGFVAIGWMFGHLGFLMNSPNAYGYVLFLLFAVEINDIAAYTFGRWLGRRPLRPDISPGKTVAGAVGACCVSMVTPFALSFALGPFGFVELLLTGVLIGVGGQIGDLSMSVIKRDLGVKDMGAVLPGHGGLLDRIDSLIFVAPLFFHMVNGLHGVYTGAP